VTVRIAGIRPFVNLGMGERNKRAEAPVGEGPGLSSSMLREKCSFCSQRAVSRLLAVCLRMLSPL